MSEEGAEYKIYGLVGKHFRMMRCTRSILHQRTWLNAVYKHDCIDSFQVQLELKNNPSRTTAMDDGQSFTLAFC